MPTLVLFRHAKAAQPIAGQRDFDRPLTERGSGDAAAMGKILARLRIDYALVSPARRTRQTWEIVSEKLSQPALSVEQELYLCGSAKLIMRLRAIPAKIQSVVSIGHNPCTQEVAHWLARNSAERQVAEIRDGFPTAAMAIFDISASWDQLSPDHATLERFVTPKMLG